MRFSFLVTELSLSQSNLRLILNINKFLKDRSDTDICVFYENKIRPCYPLNFATTGIVDAWNYSGNLIATNLSTANWILNFPKVKNKYFYVFDLEWINMPNKKYKDLSKVYQNESLKILTRSREHADQIEQVWGRPVRAVTKEFDINEIAKIVKEDEDGYRKN